MINLRHTVSTEKELEYEKHTDINSIKPHFNEHLRRRMQRQRR